LATPEAARQAVDEAVRLFLATAAEHGTLEEVLEDAGYRREGGSWQGLDWLGVERHSYLAAAYPRPCRDSPRSIGARWRPFSLLPVSTLSGRKAAIARLRALATAVTLDAGIPRGGGLSG
jgi:hypothetical protein